MSALTLVVFWRCGRSLIGAIDISLQHHREQQQQLRNSVTGDTTCDTTQESHTTSLKDLRVRGRDSTLVSARRKVNRMLVLTTLLIVPSGSLGLFAAFSSYMAEAALILDALLTWLPMAWLSVKIQLHAGRSHQSVASRPHPPASNGRLCVASQLPPLASNGGLGSPRSILSGRWNPFPHQKLVVPIEAPC